MYIETFTIDVYALLIAVLNISCRQGVHTDYGEYRDYWEYIEITGSTNRLQGVHRDYR